MEKVGSGEKDSETQNTEDLLKYRPNPDMLISKTDMTSEVGQGVKSIQNTNWKIMPLFIFFLFLPYMKKKMNAFDF